MSVLVLLEMNAKSGSAADITNWLRDGLHHTRGFDGCNSITFHSNQDDPNNMVIVEAGTHVNSMRNIWPGGWRGET